MSPSDASARPSQVSVAGWAVTVASLVLVLSAFDAHGSLNSLAVRADLTHLIRSGFLKGFGLSLHDALELKRWAIYISAVAAVATGILGVFALKRDRSARIGLSIAAVPVVLAAPFVDGFFGVVIGFGAAALWAPDARDWYAGRPITPRPARDATPQVSRPVPPAAPRPWLPATPPHVPGAPTALGELPPPVVAPPVLPHHVPDQLAPLPPRQVRVACVLTWISSGLTAFGCLLLLVWLAVDQQGLLDRLSSDSGLSGTYTDTELVHAAIAGCIVFMLWCAAASVVAVFAWRGFAWARVLLLISTVLAGIASVLGFPASVIQLVAIGASFGMLLSRPSREWFTTRRS